MTKRTIRPTLRVIENKQAIQKLVPVEYSIEDVDVSTPVFRTKKGFNPRKPIKEDKQTIQQNLPQQPNMKYLKEKFSRPYFSPNFNSYEIDLAFLETSNKRKLVYYIFLININTRYLYIMQIPDKTAETFEQAFEAFIQNGLRISNIRSDDETGLTSKNMIEYFKDNNIQYFHSPSKFTNKNRIVDRVIRTIRDMYNMKYPYVQQYVDNYTTNNKASQYTCSIKDHYNRMLELVAIYNNTYHKEIGMSPKQMQEDYNLENEYIKAKQEELDAVLRRIQNAGLMDFKYGDELIIYKDPSKLIGTKGKATYSHPITFVEYEGGNVKGNYIDSEGREQTIVVPIYHVVKYKQSNPTQIEIPYVHSRPVSEPLPKRGRPKTVKKTIKKQVKKITK